MAKKKINTSKLDLSLGKKRPIKKTTTASSKNIDSDEVVKRIHPEAELKSKTPSSKEKKPQEPTKRITLDIPISLHKQIKMHVFGLETTMKKYFLDLAAKDLEKQKS